MLIDYDCFKTLYILGDGIVAKELQAWISSEVTGSVQVISPDKYMTLPDQSQCMIGFQNIQYRQNFLLTALSYSRVWPTFIHPTAFVTNVELIESGTVISPMAAIGFNVSIAKFGMIGLHSKLGHNDKLGQNVVVSPGTTIGGSTTIGNNIFFGQSSSIRDKITICDNVIFNMNSIVTKDIMDAGVYYGNKKILNNWCQAKI
jgi:UDP-3-O-[3-hydroxymyristoyl] glucosamine N-acyltransferase